MSTTDIASAENFSLCKDASAMTFRGLVESLRAAARVHRYLRNGTTAKCLEFVDAPIWDPLAAALLARIVGRGSFRRRDRVNVRISVRAGSGAVGTPGDSNWPDALLAAGLRGGDQEVHPLLYRAPPFLDATFMGKFGPPGHTTAFAELVEAVAGSEFQKHEPGRNYMLQRIGPRLLLDAKMLGVAYSGKRRLKGRTRGVPKDAKTLAGVCQVQLDGRPTLAVMTLTDGPTIGELVPKGDPLCGIPDETARILFSQKQWGNRPRDYGLLSASIGASLPTRSSLLVASGRTVLALCPNGGARPKVVDATASTPADGAGREAGEEALEGILTCLLVDLHRSDPKVPLGSEPIAGGQP